EAGWQRCGQMSSVDGITFTPWPHATMPNWSMPALEAAKCVARQGDELFERVHPRLYEAYFTKSLNIADPRVVADIVAAEGVDMARFGADLESGARPGAVRVDSTSGAAQG